MYVLKPPRFTRGKAHLRTYGTTSTTAASWMLLNWPLPSASPTRGAFLIEGVVVGLTIVAVQNLGGQGLVGRIRRRDAFLTPSVGDVVREYHVNTALQVCNN